MALNPRASLGFKFLVGKYLFDLGAISYLLDDLNVMFLYFEKLTKKTQ